MKWNLTLKLEFAITLDWLLPLKDYEYYWLWRYLITAQSMCERIVFCSKEYNLPKTSLLHCLHFFWKRWKTAALRGAICQNKKIENVVSIRRKRSKKKNWKGEPEATTPKVKRFDNRWNHILPKKKKLGSFPWINIRYYNKKQVDLLKLDSIKYFLCRCEAEVYSNAWVWYLVQLLIVDYKFNNICQDRI